MTFYIILGIVFLISIIIGLTVAAPSKYDRYPNIGEGVAAWAASLMVGTFIGGIVLAILMSNNLHTTQYKDTEVTNLALRALGNDTNIEGRQYFLGGGYIGEEKVINFITQAPNGAIKIDKMPAAQAVIFEDSATPRLTITKTVRTMEWAVPWELGSTMHYDFHIPKGSVLESYSLDVNK